MEVNFLPKQVKLPKIFVKVPCPWPKVIAQNPQRLQNRTQSRQSEQ